VKVIFMGTPDFAVPTLDALVEAGHEIIAVVAQPDRPKGRGKKLQPPPTILRARELGIPTKQPRAVRKGPFVDWMTSQTIDVAIVVAYGRILIPALLNTPKYGCINVHASLLPKYRGAAPVHWSIYNGDNQTGICTMQMAEGMDTGDILKKAVFPIGENDSISDIWIPLANLGANLLIDTLANLEKIVPTPQNHMEATHARILKKTDGVLDWTRSAKDLHNQIRALNPWPGTWTSFAAGRLKIWKAKPCKGSGTPGEIISVKENPIVATGDGALEILVAQVPGKQKGPSKNLILSNKIKLGELIGQE